MALRILLPIVLATASLAAQEHDSNTIAEPTGELTLARALEAALQAHPDLAAASWDLPIADAQILQARLRPNPELSLEAEGIRLGGGTETNSQGWNAGLGPEGLNAGAEWSRDRADGNAFDETELTLSISQLIELGGKRAARIAAAEGGREVARWDYEAIRFRVIGDVVAAYTELLSAQARVEQAEGILDLAGRLASTVGARVEAGSVSPIERHRAQAQADRQRVGLAAAKDELDQARLRLAALWGSNDPQFSHAEGALDDMPSLAALPDILALSDAHPLMQRWLAELDRREASVALARAEGVPDLTVSLGYRATRMRDSSARGLALGTDGIGYSRGVSRSDDNWQSSVVLEASIPLPIFNRNQGNIREAELLASKASDERRATAVDLKTRLTQLHQAAQGALRRVEMLEAEVLPKLRKSYDLTEEGYRRGKFGFLEVLDAERALIEARMETLDARVEYHQSVAGLERLLGEGIFANADLTDPTDPSDHSSQEPPAKEQP
jgi:cobalt-zinc-cadmium efflux system outer membrane protein